MKILETRAYGRFSFLKGNRDINPFHLKRLKASMEQKVLESPIIVNEKMQIIDGQHRFTALMELGKPIRYIVVKGYARKEVQTYNQNQANWGYIDFLNFFVKNNKPEYVRLNDFMAEYCLRLNQARVFTEGSRKTMDNRSKRFSFKDGKFKVLNGRADELAQKYNEIRKFWKFSSQRSFIIAFIAVMKNPKVSWKRFKEKTIKYHYLVEKRATSKQYLEQLQNLYNYQSRKKVAMQDAL